MNDKRQKNQLQMALAFTGEGRSEAPRAPREGTESCTAKCATESPAGEEQLMEEATIPWITVYRGGGSSTFSTSSNVAKLWGVVLTWPVTTTQVTYNVSTADTNTSGACNYDLGIADTSGSIKAHVGSTANQTFGSSGSHTVSWTGGSLTLQPGKYYVALTTSCTANTAVLSGDGSAASVTFQNAGTAGITAGGSLTSFTAPSDARSWGTTVPAIVVR